MNSRTITLLFFAGLAVFAVGGVFKLMHWVGSRQMILVGSACCTIFGIIWLYRYIRYDRHHKNNL